MDKLHNVKAFAYRVGLSGFGARDFLGWNNLDPDVKALYNVYLPALVDAIKHDDPDWDMIAEEAAGHWIYGGLQQSLSEAGTTGAVRWYVQCLELDRALMFRRDPTDRLYVRLYQPDPVAGCFYDGLVAALRADDPDWRPTG